MDRSKAILFIGSPLTPWKALCSCKKDVTQEMLQSTTYSNRPLDSMAITTEGELRFENKGSWPTAFYTGLWQLITHTGCVPFSSCDLVAISPTIFRPNYPALLQEAYGPAHVIQKQHRQDGPYRPLTLKNGPETWALAAWVRFQHRSNSVLLNNYSAT